MLIAEFFLIYKRKKNQIRQMCPPRMTLLVYQKHGSPLFTREKQSKEWPCFFIGKRGEIRNSLSGIRKSCYLIFRSFFFLNSHLKVLLVGYLQQHWKCRHSLCRVTHLKGGRKVSSHVFSGVRLSLGVLIRNSGNKGLECAT